MFIFKNIYYYKTYKDNLKINHDLYILFNLEFKLSIELVKLFENLTMKIKEFENLTNEESCEEGFSRIIKTYLKLRVNKRFRKTKDLEPNKIDSRLILFM